MVIHTINPSGYKSGSDKQLGIHLTPSEKKSALKQVTGGVSNGKLMYMITGLKGLGNERRGLIAQNT